MVLNIFWVVPSPVNIIGHAYALKRYSIHVLADF